MILYELDGKEDFRFSPHVWKVIMTLHHKNLTDTLKIIPVKFSDKTPIKEKGFNTVPVLVDNDKWIGDSVKIAEYLDNTYPEKPSVFGDETAKNTTLILSKYIDYNFISGFARIIVGDIYNHIHPDDKEYFKVTREKMLGASIEEISKTSDERIPSLQKQLEPFRKILRETPFIAGSKPMFCDYLLFGFFMWARCSSPKTLLETIDPIREWRERMLDLYDGYARKARGYSNT